MACLIEQARVDRTAFAALFRRHHDEIYRYCARRLPCRSCAEDITSQVFMKMLKKFDTFAGDETAFRSWLFRIACNEVNSFYRTTGRKTKAYTKLQQEYDPAGTENTQDDCAEAEDNQQKLAFLKEAISTLKPELQDIVTLRFFEGLNSEQIGNVLQVKSATVRSRLARALQKLKKEYKTHQQQSPEGPCWYE